MISFMPEQNIICSQTLLNDIVHEQPTICRQLFAGHVVSSWPMKGENNLHPMIIMYNPLHSEQVTSMQPVLSFLFASPSY